MTSVRFEIDPTPLDGRVSSEPHKWHFQTAKCPGCGRFARSSQTTGYDGTWNQIYLTTYCTTCGEITESQI